MGQKLKFDLSRQLLLEYQNATSKSAWTKCAHRVFVETIVEKTRIDTCTPFDPVNCKIFLQTTYLQREPTATLKLKTYAFLFLFMSINTRWQPILTKSAVKIFHSQNFLPVVV